MIIKNIINKQIIKTNNIQENINKIKVIKINLWIQLLNKINKWKKIFLK